MKGSVGRLAGKEGLFCSVPFLIYISTDVANPRHFSVCGSLTRNAVLETAATTVYVGAAFSLSSSH